MSMRVMRKRVVAVSAFAAIAAPDRHAEAVIIRGRTPR
jgi:hypothetical protein